MNFLVNPIESKYNSIRKKKPKFSGKIDKNHGWWIHGRRNGLGENL